MSSDEELRKLRAKRMSEIQTQQQQQEEAQRAQQEAELQKQELMRKVLTPEARLRLNNIKMVRPEFAQQIEIQLLQIAQTGRVRLPIDDNTLKKLLLQIQSRQSKRDITIRRI
jgi:programmed cell death protein 5